MTGVLGELGLGPADLAAAYRARAVTPGEVVDEVYRRIEARGEDAVWISLVPHAEARAAAEVLDLDRLDELPLLGVPFSVKDNLDVAGMVTTAACPDFGYVADATATAVARLEAAGAILIGKTNLDQFATGLSGARSPYGTPASTADPTLISGGSSSGAAVSVAAGLVGFALGTDTAGSGRVPAALNGIVGVKPSIGLVSTTGLVPACESLDCVTVFTGTVGDGARVLAAMAGFDPADPGSRVLPVPSPAPAPAATAGLRLGVPAHLEGWGSRGEEKAWSSLLDRLAVAGVELVEFNPRPFLEAGQLLYGGPWVAERLAALGDFVERSPSALHPVTAVILAGAAQVSGVDAFKGASTLRALRRQGEGVLNRVDAILTPTVTQTFTLEEMERSPIELNAALGTWTTFTNLLDLAAVAVPTGGAEAPFGVTVQAESGRDQRVLAIAATIEALVTGSAPRVGQATEGDELQLAVVGAHLTGMPLHPDLLACGATLVARTRTAPTYRLYALPGGPPARPGLRRVSEDDAGIEVEVYRIPRDRLGDFMVTIPAPLGIGRVTLADGSVVHGFICEPDALTGATDITAHGGWRNYLAAQRAVASPA